VNHERTIARQRTRRRFRNRKRVRGSAERPRLSVFRSNKHMYVQVIDDLAGKTLAAASTQDKGLVAGDGAGSNQDAAKAVGKAIAERALKAGISEVCFDRREYKFHGRVAALATAAREAGLSF
jgi:large subunit ribosomal protein L18